MTKQNYEQKLVFGEDSQSCIKRKAMAKLMLDNNVEKQTIATVVGVSERQIYNYSREIESGANLYEDQHFRPVSDMKAMEDIIIKDLTEHPVSTVKQAAKRIKEITGLERGVTQVWTFMRDHGLKALKTAAVPAKMDPDEQRRFLTEDLEPRLNNAGIVQIIAEQPAATDKEPDKENVKADGESPLRVVKSTSVKESAVLFMDGAHFVWQAFIGVLWCMERIFIPASSGRQRINVLGAYDPIANKLIKIINRTYITSETVCEMLHKIKEVYIDKFVTVVLDNARYQRCDLVINTANALGIELLFLPTYSPNLNLIERLWRFVKSTCLRNEYFESSKEFETTITKCLDEINTVYAEDIKRLMSRKFHLYDTFDEMPSYFGKNKKEPLKKQSVKKQVEAA